MENNRGGRHSNEYSELLIIVLFFIVQRVTVLPLVNARVLRCSMLHLLSRGAGGGRISEKVSTIVDDSCDSRQVHTKREEIGHLAGNSQQCGRATV